MDDQTTRERRLETGELVTVKQIPGPKTWYISSILSQNGHRNFAGEVFLKRGLASPEEAFDFVISEIKAGRAPVVPPLPTR
jgi:hypothetical protein